MSLVARLPVTGPKHVPILKVSSLCSSGAGSEGFDGDEQVPCRTLLHPLVQHLGGLRLP